MKKILSLTFIVLLLPSMAFAGACPMLKSQVEDKIATLDQSKHATLISIALMLHEEGVKAHGSGELPTKIWLLVHPIKPRDINKIKSSFFILSFYINLN